MNDDQPTDRLSRANAPHLAMLLESAAGDEPTDAELGELDRRMGAQLVAPPPRPSHVGKAWLGGGAAAVVLLAAAAWWARAPASPTPEVARLAAVQPAAEPVATVSEPALAVAAAALPPGEGAVAPNARATAALAHAAPPAARVVAAAVGQKPPGPAPNQAAVAPETPARTAGVDPGDELVLLERAQAALRSGNLAEALERIAEHQRDFPEGLLVQEREVLAIEVLLDSGQRDAAQQRAAQFFERFAGSVHRTKVRALLRDGGP